MTDLGGWQPARGDSCHSFPRYTALLATATKRPPPVPSYVVDERRDRSRVRWHGMICEIPAHHLTEPAPLLGHRHMEHAIQRLLDLDELGLHALPHGVPHQQKPSLLCLRADMREAEEIERFRL